MARRRQKKRFRDQKTRRCRQPAATACHQQPPLQNLFFAQLGISGERDVVLGPMTWAGPSAGNDRGQGQTSGVPPIRAATPHMGRASTLETTLLVSRLKSLARGPEVHLANLCQSSSPFSKCPVVDRVGKCWQVCLGRLQLCRLSHPPAASRQYSNSFRT